MNNIILNKEKFNKALTYINRENLDKLVSWLETSTDFFSSPASTVYHGNYEGGLLEHSLNVLEFAINNFNWVCKSKPDYSYLKESVILCSLFHDVCKANCYSKEEKFTKNDEGKWVKYMGYTFKDEFPFGHGEKSVLQISKFIELKPEEMLAIRWHMGNFDIAPTMSNGTKMAFEQAWTHPLVKIINTADVLSTSIEDIIDYKLSAR